MANRYFLNIGANWGDTANWSNKSGGTGGFSVPTNVDDVFFDANSGNCTVNASNRTAKTLNFTGYTNTITMTFSISVSGNVTLSPSMTVIGTASSYLFILANSTLTSNGKVWTANLRFYATPLTVTLADDFEVSGIVYNDIANGSITTINGNKFKVSGNLDFAGRTGSIIQGTTTLVMSGTGSLLALGSTIATSTFEVNTTGTFTINGGFINSANVKYTAGNVTYTTALTFASASTTQSIDWTHAITGAGIQFAGSANTLTLLNNINTNTISYGNSDGVTVTVNGFQINCTGNLTIGRVSGTLTGSTIINLTGGIWSHTGATVLRMPLVLNGNITISGNVYYNTGTLTYTSGTITTTGSTINIAAATTIAVNNSGLTLNNITTSANVTFSGTNGCTIGGTYSCTTVGTTHIFVSTLTYIINALNIAGTNASRVTIRSSIASSKALINLSSIQSEYYLNVTDINGSGGSAGWTFGGTVTNSDNWNASTSLFYVGTGAFVSSSSWAAYSGGAAMSQITQPAAGDSIRFDANSVNNCTISAQTLVVFNVNFTGYSQTITLNGALYMNGALTLSPTMTIDGSSRIHIYAAAGGTVISNGKTFTANLTIEFFGSSNVTFADDFTITGLFTASNGTTIVNGTVNINCYGGITSSGLSQGTGTPVLNLYGGTWSGQFGSASGGITTNILGNITLGSSCTIFSSLLNYVSGVVNAAGNTLTCINSTLNTSGMVWNNVTFASGFGHAITSNLNVAGTLSLAGIQINGAGFRINARGNVVQTDGSVLIGTATLVFVGTGTWTNTSTGVLRLNTIINAGILTISGTVRYDTGTLTYVSGTVIANSATLLVAASTTFINMDKVAFRTITITSGTTQTFNKFFSGTPITSTRIQSSATTNYAVAFQDSFEKITKFIKISNCTVARPGQLLCLTDNSNRGGNTGIRYINQAANGVAPNTSSIPTQMVFGLASVSDPTTIVR